MAPTCVLIQGDCLNVLPLLPADRFSFAFCDLPYAHNGTTLAWDEMVPLSPLWDGLHHVLRDTWSACFTASMRLASALVQNNPKDFRYDLVFRKSGVTGYLNAKRQPLRQHELMLIFGRGGVYNPQMRHPSEHANGRVRRGKTHRREGAIVYGEHSGASTHEFGMPRYPVSIVEARRVNARGRHPTEKPLSLLTWLIKSYTQSQDWVIDPCAGSGTTAVSALAAGRNVVCIEQDSDYFEGIRRRLKNIEQEVPGIKSFQTEIAHQESLLRQAGEALGA